MEFDSNHLEGLELDHTNATIEEGDLNDEAWHESIAGAIRNLPLRISFGKGELPSEIWRMILLPQALQRRVPWGLGANNSYNEPSIIISWMKRLWGTIRVVKTAPIQFLCNLGVPVLKKAVSNVGTLAV